MIKKKPLGRPKGTTKPPTTQRRIPDVLLPVVDYLVELFKTKNAK